MFGLGKKKLDGVPAEFGRFESLPGLNNWNLILPTEKVHEILTEMPWLLDRASLWDGYRMTSNSEKKWKDHPNWASVNREHRGDTVVNMRLLGYVMQAVLPGISGFKLDHASSTALRESTEAKRFHDAYGCVGCIQVEHQGHLSLIAMDHNETGQLVLYAYDQNGFDLAKNFYERLDQLCSENFKRIKQHHESQPGGFFLRDVGDFLPNFLRSERYRKLRAESDETEIKTESDRQR